MNRLSKKQLRIVTLLIIFSFAMLIMSSPAYSRDRRNSFPRHHHGSHYGRIFPDGDVLPALLAAGLIAGVTFSMIKSAAPPPVHEYRVAHRRCEPSVAPTAGVSIVSGGSVMVTAQLLNVRTRPSLNAPLMVQIPYGTVLTVYDNAHGWYYVDLPGNRSGWVMAQFTEPVGYSGEG